MKPDAKRANPEHLRGSRSEAEECEGDEFRRTNESEDFRGDLRGDR